MFFPGAVAGRRCDLLPISVDVLCASMFVQCEDDVFEKILDRYTLAFEVQPLGKYMSSQELSKKSYIQLHRT